MIAIIHLALIKVNGFKNRGAKGEATKGLYPNIDMVVFSFLGAMLL